MFVFETAVYAIGWLEGFVVGRLDGWSVDWLVGLLIYWLDVFFSSNGLILV